MRLSSNRLSVLLSHGLQESEARVYLALIDHSSLAASTLAKAARVPRSYLYNVLQDLHARGLVDILVAGGKRTYRARPFDEFLAREAEELRARLAELDVEIRTLTGVMSPPALEPTVLPEAGEVRVLIGRQAVAREIEDILHHAATRVVIEASQGGLERVGKHVHSLIVSPLLPHGMEIVVYLPPGAAREFLGGEVATSTRVVTRHLRSPSPTLVVCADGDRLLLIHPMPDSADLRLGRDFALYTSDRAFIESRLQLLRDASEE